MVLVQLLPSQATRPAQLQEPEDMVKPWFAPVFVLAKLQVDVYESQ
jgi:hypothetical protein